MDETGLRPPIVQGNLEEDDRTNPLSAEVLALDQGSMSQSEYLLARKHFAVFLAAQLSYDQYVRQNVGIRRRVILNARAQQLAKQKDRQSSRVLVSSSDSSSDDGTIMDHQDNQALPLNVFEEEPQAPQPLNAQLGPAPEALSSHPPADESSSGVPVPDPQPSAEQVEFPPPPEPSGQPEGQDPRSSQFLFNLKQLTSKFPKPSLSHTREPPTPVLNENGPGELSSSPKKPVKAKKKT